MDMLKEIMQKQAELQARVDNRYLSDDPKVVAAYMRDHRGYLADEVAEALYEMPDYKHWKDYSNMDEEARVYAWQKVRMELIDSLHFFVNLLLGSGLTAEEVYEMYMAKNKENHRRQDAGYTSDVSYREQSVEDVMEPTCTLAKPGEKASSTNFIAFLFNDKSCDIAVNTDILSLGLAASILQAKYTEDLKEFNDDDRVQIEANIADVFNTYMEAQNE